MKRDIIAIGGSAGCLEALQSTISSFPADFCGNVFVFVHIGPGRSQLAQLLADAGNFPVSFARHSELIERGHIYVAPADRHLIVEPGLLRLSPGPREHFTRPAIDPLFRSLASTYRERVIGVVLSGGGSDGAAGLDAVKRAGGFGVVVDPREALAADMPTAAVEIADPDFIAAEAELPALLVRLSREAVPVAAAEPPGSIPKPIQSLEHPLALTCPDCGGALRKTGNGTAAQYRCHIGHVFGAREFIPAQLDLIEKALDVAQRVLNERIELSRQMAEDSRIAGRMYALDHWERVRAEAEKQVEIIRQVLPNGLEAEDHLQEAPK